jgi:hypothetical protein
MYTTFQNIKTTSIDFDSLVGKYLCFLSEGPEDLKMTEGKYVTNCNYIYKVIRNTSSFMIVDFTFSNGQTGSTKLRKETFEKEFFSGHYVICNNKPDWGVEVGTYTIKLPNYTFNPTTDLTKPFTTDEINELLTSEFLGTTKSYHDVQECIETLCNIIMKRHFDYINISRSYFQYTNDLHVGLNIKSGYKSFDRFGKIEVKSYRNKITYIKFELFDWINRYTGYEDFKFSSLEDLICTFLNKNQEYINNL